MFCKMTNDLPKGKQGTRGQKQIVEENKDTLNFYWYIISAVNMFYIMLTYLFFWESFTIGIIFMVLTCLAIYIGAYQFMKFMAKATYDPSSGALYDSGTDLNMEQGLSEHIKDLILVTAITQTLALLSNYFWLILLSAPGRALYLLWVNVLGPWFFAPPPEVDEKKQKKLERKMKRRQ